MSAATDSNMAMWKKGRSLIRSFPLLQHQLCHHAGSFSFSFSGERLSAVISSPIGLLRVLDRCSHLSGAPRGQILPSGCRFLASDGKEQKNMVSESSKEDRVSSYCGVMPPTVTRKDGTGWPWNCFMPCDTYTADLSIDLSKHHKPRTFTDKFAYRTVKLLRIPTDIFSGRYGCRAMMLETVAAVPGMVGGMLLHLKSLRRFQHSGGWIRALLEEAENERMHLMTMVEMVKPKWYERALVITVQGVFFNLYFLIYLVSPKLAHRIVGYLEEEAIHSYTEFLKEIDGHRIENVPAPEIAKDYWRLPEAATLRDVVVVIRADEAHHRDVNHFAADVHHQGKELKEAPAPLGYH